MLLLDLHYSCITAIKWLDADTYMNSADKMIFKQA